jgi:hypothetical protein
MSTQKIRLWSAASLAVLFIPFGFLARANDGFTDGGGIPCIWRSLTGYPCPGCGLTRAFASISNLNIIESIRFNPKALLFTVIALLAVITPAWFSHISGKFKRLFQSQSDKKVLFLSVAFFAVLWILNIIRVSTGFYPELV